MDKKLEDIISLALSLVSARHSLDTDAGSAGALFSTEMYYDDLVEAVKNYG